jgi:hypothetical protein
LHDTISRSTANVSRRSAITLPVFFDSIGPQYRFGQSTKYGQLTRFKAPIAPALGPPFRRCGSEMPTISALQNRALKLTKSPGTTKGIAYDKDEGRCDPSPSDRRRDTGAIGDGRHRGYDAKDRS